MLWKLTLGALCVLLPLCCGQPLVAERCRPYNTRHCYTLYGSSTTDFTWYQADAFCKNISQHLVSIPDKQTEDLLIPMMRDSAGVLTSGYAWTVGQTSNDTRWRNIEGEIYTGYVSASRDTEACGSLSQRRKPTGELAIVVTGQACNTGRHPLCQVPRDGFCLYNEIAIPPYCYRLLDHAASWFDAEVKCEEYAPGAHLAYTHISDKTFLETIMLDQAISLGETTWVGIYMRPWFWRLNECSFDKRNMLYSNWDYVSHPPLGTTPEALAIGKTGRWRDYLVTRIQDYFICEKDDGVEDGHYFGPIADCPTPLSEDLPTVPLKFPSTTMLPTTEPGDKDKTSKAKTQSIAALVVAVLSIVVTIICVIAACIAVSQFKKSLEKMQKTKPSNVKPPATRLSTQDYQNVHVPNGGYTNVWHHDGGDIK